MSGGSRRCKAIDLPVVHVEWPRYSANAVPADDEYGSAGPGKLERYREWTRTSVSSGTPDDGRILRQHGWQRMRDRWGPFAGHQLQPDYLPSPSAARVRIFCRGRFLEMRSTARAIKWSGFNMIERVPAQFTATPVPIRASDPALPQNALHLGVDGINHIVGRI